MVEMLRETASALWAMLDSPANQASIALEGGIPLIALLDGYPEPTATRRARCGPCGGAGQPGHDRLVQRHRAAGRAALRDVKEAQDTAAGVSVLAAQAENRASIAKAGGVLSLVALWERLDGRKTRRLARRRRPPGATRSSPSRKSLSRSSPGRRWRRRARRAVKARAFEHATRLMRDLAMDPAAGAIADAARCRSSSASSRTAPRPARAWRRACSQIALRSTEHRTQVTQELVVLLGSEAAVRRRAADALRHGGRRRVRRA